MANSDYANSPDAKKKHARKIVQGLQRAYPEATCALHHKSDYQLLVATILSAQCTDKRVNMVTPAVFKKFPTVSKLAVAKQKDVERIIKSTGFFRAKATNLRAMAQRVVEEFDGELPRDIDQMVTLSGVGRKTANVVLGTMYGIASGVVVDTHVKRISRLLGLTESSNPDRIERDLMQVLPKKEWVVFSHRMIHHGRKICIARRPTCIECPLLKLCPRVGLPPLDRQTF